MARESVKSNNEYKAFNNIYLTLASIVKGNFELNKLLSLYSLQIHRYMHVVADNQLHVVT